MFLENFLNFLRILNCMVGELIAQGAEAKIFHKDGVIIKERFAKEYRIPEIDIKLRKFRTRRESKVLKKLNELGIPCPDLFDVDDKDMRISMEFLDGLKLRDVLQDDPDGFGEIIGRQVGLMHSNDVIHADLTTSNMVLNIGKIHFIDFGLSFFSTKAEDKAVDLHLLNKALESRHSDIYQVCWEAVIRGYKAENPEAGVVLERLAKVSLRGRHKLKSSH